MSHDFRNEPHIDWNAKNVTAMKIALHSIKKYFGRHCPVLIDGKDMRKSNDRLFSLDPSRVERVFGTAGAADKVDVEYAAGIAKRAWDSWRNLTVAQKSDVFLKAAKIFRENKFKLAANIVFEVSKSWDAAISEVEEAINFIEFYRKAMIDMSEVIPHQPWIKSEKNYSRFIQRGITGIIKAWNFPVGLTTEAIVASLAASSPVLFKPAEQSPICGFEVVKYFLEAGVPTGVLAYLPGFADTGKAIVSSPMMTQITFTGSREVGMHIYETAAKNPSYFGPKKVDLELGGNNSMIVGESAMHDGVVKDVVISKFGFMGQKCSALQRLIVISENLSDPGWLTRLNEAMLSMQIGHPENPAHRHSALIDETAYDRYNSKLEILEKNYHGVVHQTSLGGGYFVRPGIFTNVPHDSPLVQEEVFGPLLFVFKARNIAEAVALANQTDFALTSGIHTESEAEIQYFLENIESGNPYVNRPITGSQVGRQPFGGYKSSGFGEKVGSPDRLRFFMNHQSVAINLKRHGTIL